jgi:hypothetical protein
MSREKSLVPPERIEHAIFLLGGQKVVLDADLAALYGVPTKAFNQAVTRNLGRFPADFMFQLTDEEFADLRSQSATSSWGGRRYSIERHLSFFQDLEEVGIANGPELDQIDGDAEKSLEIFLHSEVVSRVLRRRKRCEFDNEIQIADRRVKMLRGRGAEERQATDAPSLTHLG